MTEKELFGTFVFFLTYGLIWARRLGFLGLDRPAAALAAEPWGMAALAGSNLVSNVPFILLVREQMAALPDQALGWELLAMASTFAGNLTLLGSVAPAAWLAFVSRLV